MKVIIIFLILNSFSMASKTLNENIEAERKKIKGGFSVRTIKGEGYVALINDRASGRVKEDIYIYVINSNSLKLVFVLNASKQVSSSIEVTEKLVKLLDINKKEILRFSKLHKNSTTQS